MKVEIYIGFNSKMRISTQFKNALTNYTKLDMFTNILVLLPVDWDEIGLVSTKRLHIMNIIIGHS